jgi:outer membrane murein-binding lipoprotein Lpp
MRAAGIVCLLFLSLLLTGCFSAQKNPSQNSLSPMPGDLKPQVRQLSSAIGDRF